MVELILQRDVDAERTVSVGMARPLSEKEWKFALKLTQQLQQARSPSLKRTKSSCLYFYFRARHRVEIEASSARLEVPNLSAPKLLL